MKNLLRRLVLITSLLVTVSLSLMPLGSGPFVPAQVSAADNPIVIENQQPGSTGWQFSVDASGTPSNATNHEIEGYASLTSVNKGGQISFMVSLSSAAQYTMDVYRMGYYGGSGGRLMQT